MKPSEIILKHAYGYEGKGLSCTKEFLPQEAFLAIVEYLDEEHEKKEKLEEAILFLAGCVETGSWVDTRKTINEILDEKTKDTQ